MGTGVRKGLESQAVCMCVWRRGLRLNSGLMEQGMPEGLKQRRVCQ